MKLFILLLVVKKVVPLDLTSVKIPGGWSFQDVMNHLHQKGYSGGYNVPGDTRRFDICPKPPCNQQQQPYPGVLSDPNDGQRIQNCCPRGDCPNPCLSLGPYFPPPILPRAPVMVPLRAYYEKVYHDHPRIGKIKDIIKKDKKAYKRWKKQYKNLDSWEDDDSSTSESSDTDTDTDMSSNEDSPVPT